MLPPVFFNGRLTMAFLSLTRAGTSWRATTRNQVSLAPNLVQALRVGLPACLPGCSCVCEADLGPNKASKLLNCTGSAEAQGLSS